MSTEFICKTAAQKMFGTLKSNRAHPNAIDYAKIQRFVAGFRCHKSFRTGVRESVAWLRSHGRHAVQTGAERQRSGVLCRAKLIKEGAAGGQKRKAFIYFNNRLEGNALTTITAMLEQAGEAV